MMKKTNTYYKNLTVILLVCLIAGSCKKSGHVGSGGDLIANAKAWFQKSQEGLTITVYGQGGSMPLRFTPQWEKAQTEIIEGNNVLLVPVNTNLSKSLGTQVQFNLLVKSDENGYESQVIGVRDTGSDKGETMSLRNLFYTVFTDKNIAESTPMNVDVTLFNSKFQATSLVRYAQQDRKDVLFDRTNLRISTYNVDGSLKLPKNNIFANIKPPTGDCVEQTWYMVEFVYDSEGQLLYYDVLWQLPSTFICDGGAGGGGAPPSVLIDFGIPVSEDMGGSAEQEIIVGADHFKVKQLKWKFHNGYTYYGESTERGAVKVVGAVRTWDGLTHIRKTVVGVWALGDFDFIALTFTPLFTVGSTSYASMSVDYQLEYALSGGPTFKSLPQWSGATWNVNFVKQ